MNEQARQALLTLIQEYTANLKCATDDKERSMAGGWLAVGIAGLMADNGAQPVYEWRGAGVTCAISIDGSRPLDPDAISKALSAAARSV